MQEGNAGKKWKRRGIDTSLEEFCCKTTENQVSSVEEMRQKKIGIGVVALQEK